jgi:hypothetical protein
MLTDPAKSDAYDMHVRIPDIATFIGAQGSIVTYIWGPFWMNIAQKRVVNISIPVHIYPLKPLPIDSASFFASETYDVCQMSTIHSAVHRPSG